MSEHDKQYIALNGSEIIDYICAEIRTALVRSGQLPLHRAFHEMTFVGGIKVTGWGTADAKVKVAGVMGEGHPDDAEVVEFKVGVEAQSEPPSLVRERLAGEQSIGQVASTQFEEAFQRTIEQPILDEMKVEIGAVDVLPVSVAVDDPEKIESVSVAIEVDDTGGFPCPNFGNGCDHEPFPKESGAKVHAAWWCKVSGKKWRR